MESEEAAAGKSVSSNLGAGSGESRSATTVVAPASVGANAHAVLSGNTEVEDKVLLLELGADDYVTKPFSPKELLARVRRAMRRTGTMLPIAAQIQTRPISQEILTFGEARIDFKRMAARRAGKIIILTAQEFKLLKYLAHSGERVISRNELITEVWGYQSYPTTRTVDNFVLRLRQKLEPDPSTPRFLVTMHGAGYKFIPEGRSPT